MKGAPLSGAFFMSAGFWRRPCPFAALSIFPVDSRNIRERGVILNPNDVSLNANLVKCFTIPRTLAAGRIGRVDTTARIGGQTAS